MANKKISELVSRTPSLTDLMLVGDPSSGYSYKCTITELSTLLEANITLNDLNNVVITAPTNGQVLTYNGTNWVNGNNGITEINGLTATSQSFSVGTSGTDFAIVSSISTHTFNLPTASATNRGALSSADWSTFNSKIGGSGTTNYLSKFTGTSTIGNSLLFDNGTNVGVGTASPIEKLTSNGLIAITGASATAYYVGNNNAGFFDYNSGDSRIGSQSSAGSSRITFYTTSSGYTGIAERMRLDASGNLGLGTSNPAYKLDVNGDASSYSVFVNGGSAIGGALRIKQYSSSEANLDGYNTISTLNTGVFYFTAATTSPNFKSFVIDPSGLSENTLRTFTLPNASGTIALTSDITSAISGTTNYIPKFTSSSAIGNSQIFDNGTNVGIGTTSPTYKLNVVASAGTQAIFQAGQSGVSNGYTINSNGTNLTYQWHNGVGEAMRLDASGNLGLGVVPSAWTGIFSNAIDIKATASIAATSTSVGIFNNTYWSGTSYIYKITDFATSYRQYSGTHNWFIAPSGTAGSAISFTQAMTLNASGNLGLGASSPQVAGSGYTGLDIRGTTGGSIVLGSSSTLSAYIYATASNLTLETTSTRPILFSAGGSEKMRLDASGNLGLGTSSPTAVNANRRTQVIRGTSSELLLQSSNATDGTSVGITYTAAGNDAYFVNRLDGFYSWITGAAGNTERMRLDASGNLGLGVTPSAWSSGGRIEIGNDKTIVAQGPSILLGANLYFNSGFKYVTTGASTFYYQTGGQHQWFTAPSGTAGNAISFTQAMTLDASGRLGIGTTSPTAGLTLNNATEVRFRMNIADVNQIILNHDGSTGIFRTESNTPLTFGTYATERMRITSGGNVGIGTTTPSSRLSVNLDNFPSDGGIIARFTGGTTTPTTERFVEIFQGYTGGAYDSPMLVFRSNTNASNNSSYGIVRGTADGALVFSNVNNTSAGVSAATERMRITSGGELLINTTSDAGDYKLQVNGNVYMSGGTSAPLFTLKAGTTGQAVGIFDISGFSGDRVGLAVIGHASQAYNYFQIGKSSADDILKVTSAGNLELGGSLKIGGNFTTPISIKTGNYTLGASDYTVVFDISANTTATLPNATTCTGRIYTIKANVSNTSTLTIDGNGSQTIDGNTTLDLNCKGSVIIQSDGSNWRILSIYLDGTCL